MGRIGTHDGNDVLVWHLRSHALLHGTIEGECAGGKWNKQECLLKSPQISSPQQFYDNSCTNMANKFLRSSKGSYLRAIYYSFGNILSERKRSWNNWPLKELFPLSLSLSISLSLVKKMQNFPLLLCMYNSRIMCTIDGIFESEKRLLFALLTFKSKIHVKSERKQLWTENFPWCSIWENFI